MSCKFCGLENWSDISESGYCPNCLYDSKGQSLFEPEPKESWEEA